MKAPATGTASLRDGRQGWAALDFGEEREIAQLRRLWESLDLEIIRVLEASNQLKESPDYELHRLTTQAPAFFDETVRRHIKDLEKEVAVLEKEADELAREIEELTGGVRAWARARGQRLAISSQGVLGGGFHPYDHHPIRLRAGFDPARIHLAGRVTEPRRRSRFRAAFASFPSLAFVLRG